MDDPKSSFLSPDAHSYLVAHGAAPVRVQMDLIAETAALGGISMMQISRAPGAFMPIGNGPTVALERLCNRAQNLPVRP